MIAYVEVKDIHYQWVVEGEDCFSCPCGARGILLSAAGSEKACSCGRKYRLIHYVAVEKKVQEPMKYGMLKDIEKDKDTTADPSFKQDGSPSKFGCP